MGRKPLSNVPSPRYHGSAAPPRSSMNRHPLHPYLVSAPRWQATAMPPTRPGSPPFDGGHAAGHGHPCCDSRFLYPIFRRTGRIFHPSHSQPGAAVPAGRKSTALAAIDTFYGSSLRATDRDGPHPCAGCRFHARLGPVPSWMRRPASAMLASAPVLQRCRKPAEPEQIPVCEAGGGELAETF